MAKGNGSMEKRVSFLEKAYLEDRKRWERTERVMVGMLQAIRRQGEELKALGERLDAHGERLDAVVKILRRKLEE